MSKKTLNGWELLFSTDMLLPFIFGGVALSVLGNSIFTLLTNWLSTSSSALLRISSVALLLIILSGWLLRKFLYARQLESFSIGKKIPDQRKGLIVLVSNIITARKAIALHQELLTKCWLICSDSSEKIGNELIVEFENLSAAFEIITIGDLDVFDPVIFKNKVDQIYSNLPDFFQENDVILDFTGMTAVASVGSVLACVGRNRPMQYVPAPYNQNLRAIQALEPIEIELN
jgi:hypothetical protein